MIENGKIYKYTNLINGMVYIGQTKQTLEQRDYKHQIQLNDNTYFHRAIKKYGRNNFSLELVEDIGKEYGIAKNTVGDISRGLTWKNITQQFKCPIRKNKLENQKIYQSIYGIV